jgi:hypothetical protein
MKATRVVLVFVAVAVVTGWVLASLTDSRITDFCRRVWVGLMPAARKPPARGSDQSGRVPLLGARFLDDSGYQITGKYTPPIEYGASLEEVRRAVRARAENGRSTVMGQLERLEASPGDRAGHHLRRAELQAKMAMTFMYEGRFREVGPWLERAVEENPDLPPDLQANLLALEGVAALRRGEVENCVACVGPSSCIYPIAYEARHLQQSGSREAMGHFLAYLRRRPEDLGVRWLLAVAAMTLGEYPSGVPAEFRLPPKLFASTLDIGRFPNIAASVGVDVRGPNQFGGCLFDDFTGDGLPDLFICSADCDLDAALFVNHGDRFVDRGAAAGLAGQTLAANASHADFDNDGNLDVLLLRGGWESPRPLSLLRNKGKGVFEDVTAAAGLTKYIQSQSGAWGDYDNDGFVDLYVVGEASPGQSHPRNLGRLYHNNRNGTFADLAERAGVTNGGFGKGAAWGDYDGDGWPDLYVSNMNGANRLYRNNGDGTFTDVAPALGVIDPRDSFSCWFWDYDNDGLLDLFVAGFQGFVHDVIADALGLPNAGEHPRLYKNLGKAGFRDVAGEVGLGRVFLTMGSNFADVDNDGYLDIYLGTGRPNYSSLVPNVMLKNAGGRRFEDVSVSSGTAHLQKGHGVAFADWDGDGDLDLFAQMGGATPGDRAHNAFFQNPGHRRHWLAVKLVGTRTNRAAIGAKLRVEIKSADGTVRSVFRTVSAGSSYGGNSFTQHVGLGEATVVETVDVSWPTSRSRQEFHAVPADRTIEITEGAGGYRTTMRKGEDRIVQSEK